MQKKSVNKYRGFEFRVVFKPVHKDGRNYYGYVYVKEDLAFDVGRYEEGFICECAIESFIDGFLEGANCVAEGLL